MISTMIAPAAARTRALSPFAGAAVAAVVAAPVWLPAALGLRPSVESAVFGAVAGAPSASARPVDGSYVGTGLMNGTQIERTAQDHGTTQANTKQDRPPRGAPR